MGCHAELQYLTDPTFDNFESANARTLCGPNAALFSAGAGRGCRPGHIQRGPGIPPSPVAPSQVD